MLNSSPPTRATPWLRQLVANLSLQMPRFKPTPVHVGLLVDKVALGHVYLQVLKFSFVHIIPPMLHTHSLTHLSITTFH